MTGGKAPRKAGDEDARGVHCEHGQRVMVPDPVEADDLYPSFRMADPWPCDAEGCTAERLAAENEAEALEYERDRWLEYYRMVG